jgi:CubicO group peptidase (beta-lactamase class C family)
MVHSLKLLFLLLSLSVAARPAEAAQGPKLEAAVADYLAPLLRTNNFSGVVLVAKGDTIVFQKGYGRASIEHGVPNGPSTVLQIASISKPFTAAAAMLLAEQGKIDLKAPLRRVLPGYPNGDKLTVHHLLSHTSGIPNINDFDDYGELQRRPHTTEQLVAHFKDRTLEFEPGARYSYSNSNYNLLAHIIEKVSGQDFGTFLERSIFTPLGLDHTGHARPGEIVPQMANGYAPAGSLGIQRSDYLDWSVKTGNGSLYSDAAGVMRFMRGVHQGKLLNARSLSASFTPHTPNVGYGWFLSKANGREIHHINGRSPGWAAQADYYIADGVTVVVLSNLYVSVATDIARAVGALYFGEPVKPMPDLRADPLSAPALAAISGTYQFGPDYYVPNATVTVRGRDGQVEASVGEYPPFPFITISPTSFLIRSFWVPAGFTIGPDGRASGMTIDGFKGRRIG